MLHSSIGTLHYSYNEGYGYRLVLKIDQGISDFYRSLIPTWEVKRPQKYPAHISIVRKETPLYLDYWGTYEGRKIPFLYSPDIQCDDNYWWLDAYSVELEQIREELGLPVVSLYKTPEIGFKKVFHTAIANRKRLP